MKKGENPAMGNVEDLAKAAEQMDEQAAMWAHQIGRVVMAFGEIEWLVCQTLIHVPEKNQYERLKNHDFKVLAKHAIECVTERVTNKQARKALVHTINEAVKLAAERNL